MLVSVILGHPDPASFNHAIALAACDALAENGHRAACHDLYAEGFPALLPAEEIPADGPVDPTVQVHCREIAEADGIIVVHPNWWGQPPAVLKGWVDRVMRPGVAYRFLEGDGGEGVPQGLLKARAALVFNTANTPEKREKEAFGDPLELIWKNCIFELCGVSCFYRRTFATVVDSSLEARRAWLSEVHEAVNRFFPKENG